MTATALMICLYSCSKKLDGKIEVREKNKVYLVNKSTDKSFLFTVKTTSVINDSVYNYKTQRIELVPGDEAYLGYAFIKNIEPTNQYGVSEKLTDSIYLDSDGAPIPPSLLKFIPVKKEYKYEVTGQAPLKK